MLAADEAAAHRPGRSVGCAPQLIPETVCLAVVLSLDLLGWVMRTHCNLCSTSVTYHHELLPPPMFA